MQSDNQLPALFLPMIPKPLVLTTPLLPTIAPLPSTKVKKRTQVSRTPDTAVRIYRGDSYSPEVPTVTTKPRPQLVIANQKVRLIVKSESLPDSDPRGTSREIPGRPDVSEKVSELRRATEEANEMIRKRDSNNDLLNGVQIGED